MIKNYQPEQLSEEVSLIANQLGDDMHSEKALKNIRALEIDYCLINGLKGEFDVKTFGLSYPTFYKWLIAYSYSDERKQAFMSMEIEKERKQLSAVCEITPHEQRRIMINGVNMAYQEYLQDAQKRTSSPLEKVLFKIHDFGGMRDRFLTKEGLKPHDMPLNLFFDKCRREKIDSLIELIK